MMPLAKDESESGTEKYCSNCCQGGKLCYEGNDLQEFQKHAYDGMRAKGMGALKARVFTWLIRFAPRWRKK